MDRIGAGLTEAPVGGGSLRVDWLGSPGKSLLTFAPSRFDGIVADMDAHSDQVKVDPAITKPVFSRVEPGADSLLGAVGNHGLDGGNSSDSIDVRGGDDAIIGGPGHDHLGLVDVVQSSGSVRIVLLCG